MNQTIKAGIFLIGVAHFTSCAQPEEKELTFKDAFEGHFLVGTALNTYQVAGRDSQAIDLTKKHFNSIVAENCMKMAGIHPRENSFFWEEADAFVEFGEANNMHIVGHTLVWHSQAGDWVFVDEEGNDVSRDVLIERMRNHIHTVVSRYKGRVDGWDVVNETILDDGSWRQSKWVEIIGPEFVQLAFEFAHEADPEAELYYNDYSVSTPAKRDGIYYMVKDLIDKGVKIDAVGLQGHLTMASPTVNEMEEAIQKLASLGVKTMITELDITVLPWPSEQVTAEVSLNYELEEKYNPYAEGISEEANAALMTKYEDFFAMFLRNSAHINRVTFWGVTDGQSWRNNWPIRGRVDYPLLFDRDYNAKPAVANILKMTQEK
jgi:endo-1,4-beta-xylanase